MTQFAKRNARVEKREREKERSRIRWQQERGDRLLPFDEERTNEERKKDGVTGGKG